MYTSYYFVKVLYAYIHKFRFQCIHTPKIERRKTPSPPKIEKRKTPSPPKIESRKTPSPPTFRHKRKLNPPIRKTSNTLVRKYFKISVHY